MNIFQYLSKMFLLIKKNKINPALLVNSYNSKVEVQNKNIEESISLNGKYPGLSDEEIYYLLEDKDNNDEKLTKAEEQFLQDNSWSNLATIIKREHEYGKSLAIQNLLSNEYEILKDEFGNPSKEIINYALITLFQKSLDNISETKNIIISAFPIMQSFILNKIDLLVNRLDFLNSRNIYKMGNDPKQLFEINFIINSKSFNHYIDGINVINEQDAYCEFQNYVIQYLQSSYYDKLQRENEIGLYFKYLKNDLIRILDNS